MTAIVESKRSQQIKAAELNRETRAKNVLPNINRTQATASVHCHHPVTPDGN